MLNKTPIIITGMHRSGTTLVSQILSDCGVNMGWPLDPNHESKVYMSMNEWILRYAGTTWQYPLGISRLIENELAFDDAVSSLSRASNSFSVKIGHQIFRRFKKKAWGWKDPRNTITLPFWLKVYPEAKVLNVMRNGVPVSASMVVRRENSVQKINNLKYRIAAPFRPGILYGSRVWDMQEVIEMWDEYCQLADSNLNKFPGKLFTIRYEELLENPIAEIEAMLTFLGISVEEDIVNKSAERISKSNAYKFRKKPNLVKFEKFNKELLKKHGY